MAQSQVTGKGREFRDSRFDQRIADWLDVAVLLSLGLSTMAADSWGPGAVSTGTAIFALALSISFQLRLSRTTCYLSDESLVIKKGLALQSLALAGLRAEIKDREGLICLYPQGIEKLTLYGAVRLDSDRLLEALAAAGVEVTGRPSFLKITDPHDFELDSPLTDAVNWRWQGCKTPDLGLDAVIGSTDTQTVRVKEGRLSLIRKGREVASFDVKELTLIRQYKQAQPETARLVLRVGSRDLWPLSDWDSPVETKLFADLTAQGMPVEEQAWVRRQEVFYN